jgi:hypothetical protein
MTIPIQTVTTTVQVIVDIGAGSIGVIDNVGQTFANALNGVSVTTVVNGVQTVAAVTAKTGVSSNIPTFFKTGVSSNIPTFSNYAQNWGQF